MEQRKKMRVSQDHWKTVLEFAEIHPEIITNKFSDHLQGRNSLGKLWEELANKLNSQAMGCRTVEEWKKTIADWKSKTKKKSSEQAKDYVQTGGGPANAIPLNSLEEKLLSIMGQRAVFGDSSAPEKGLPTKRKAEPELGECSYSVETAEPMGESSEERCNLTDEPGQMLFDDYAEVIEAGNDHTYAAEEIPHMKKNYNTDSLSKAHSGKKKLQKPSLEEMHNEVLGVLKNIDSHLNGMDINIESIAQSLVIISKNFKK